MKPIKRFSSIFAVSFLLNPVFAENDFPVQPPSSETNPFLDPAFQDFVEMAYGYRNPKNSPGSVNDFRDALTSLPAAAPGAARPAPLKSPVPASSSFILRPPSPARPAAAKPVPGQQYKVTFANESGPISAYVDPLGPGALSGFSAGDYAFISVLPKGDDHAAVVKALSGTRFKFAGEKTYFNATGKKTFLLGWAPCAELESIYKNPKVRRVGIEKKSSGVPFRTRIRFTLRAPGGELSDAFVSDFIRRLTADADFASERVFRLPHNSVEAKFTAFEITGSLPVDMVDSVSRSPFVAAVEFKDTSL